MEVVLFDSCRLKSELHDEGVGHEIMWGSSSLFIDVPLHFTRRYLRSMPQAWLEFGEPSIAWMCHAVAGQKSVVMDW